MITIHIQYDKKEKTCYDLASYVMPHQGTHTNRVALSKASIPIMTVLGHHMW